MDVVFMMAFVLVVLLYEMYVLSLRRRLRGEEGRATKLDERLAAYNKEAAVDERVAAAKHGEMIAWRTAQRYMAACAAQSCGMKRMARKIKRLRANLAASNAARDVFKSHVVYGFYEERLPQFQQGGDQHELAEPVTAAQCAEWVKELDELRDAS